MSTTPKIWPNPMEVKLTMMERSSVLSFLRKMGRKTRKLKLGNLNVLRVGAEEARALK